MKSNVYMIILIFPLEMIYFGRTGGKKSMHPYTGIFDAYYLYYMPMAYTVDQYNFLECNNNYG